VNDEVAGLTGDDRNVARLILVVAKASYQVDDALVQAVLGQNADQEKLIRVLAFASLSAARRVAANVAKRVRARQLVNSPATA